MVSLEVLVRAAPILAGVAALAGCAGTSHPGTMSPSAETTQGKFVNVVKTVSPAVVQIQTSSGLGSGVVFDARGNVVTNNHVVGGAKRFTATLSGGKRVPATLVGTSPGNDLAVIHLTGATPSPATFGDSSKIEVGYLALAIGNPLGLHSSVSQGIVSSVSRTVSEETASPSRRRSRPVPRSTRATRAARSQISTAA
jgi:putative serine protease PepD